MYNPQLKILLEVADKGSFSKASEVLFLTPTAVMKQINQLEDRLGFALLKRTARGVHLTEAGLSICQDARSITAACQDAVDRARTFIPPGKKFS